MSNVAGMPTTATAKGKGTAKSRSLTEQELQQTLQRLQTELQNLGTKITELEAEADEHELVLSALKEALQKDPKRKCFRMIGGVLVERTVADVAPQLQTNRDGIKSVVNGLVNQYKTKDEEFETLKREYNVRPMGRVQ